MCLQSSFTFPLRLKLKCDRKLPCGSCSKSDPTISETTLNLSQLGEVVHHYVPMVCLLRATVLGKFEGESLQPPSPTHPHRSALADSAHLHTKISEMGERIRQLEGALASSHSVISNGVHPLLKEELLSIGKYN